MGTFSNSDWGNTIFKQRPVKTRSKLDAKLVNDVEEGDDVHSGLLAERAFEVVVTTKVLWQVRPLSQI